LLTASRSPKFTVAMVRTPGLSPYHARFQVPLDFSKYDLRDYLYHAYNVRCFNVRSNVKQMPVRDTQEQPRHWFRPDSKKFMTVEMEQPFVWPETPDLAPWGKKEKQKDIKNAMTASGAMNMEDKRAEAKALREQVKMLLSKKEPVQDQSLQRKIKTGRALTTADMEKIEQIEKRQADLKKMSPLELWEEQRTLDVVQSDGDKGYAIKV
jgi:large subunit ribosomal protein L23